MKCNISAVRPDGRPLGLPRPISVSLGAVTTADASALVKIGASTALAGIKCEVVSADGSRPGDEGTLSIEVEMPPLCSAECRPGRPSERAAVVAEQLSTLILGRTNKPSSAPGAGLSATLKTNGEAGIIDLRQFCIDTARASWAVYVDVYVLDDDGALLDTCLMATIAALRGLRLPRVKLDEAGNVVASDDASNNSHDLRGNSGGLVSLRSFPVALTCALHGDKFLVDPTVEEERLVDSVISMAVNDAGDIVYVSKPGGKAAMTPDRLRLVHEATKARGLTVRQIVEAVLAEHDAQ